MLEFAPGPKYGKCCLAIIIMHQLTFNRLVWCWGWDGAGDLDGPDVDPIWEAMPNRTTLAEAVTIKHDRSLDL